MYSIYRGYLQVCISYTDIYAHAQGGSPMV